MPTTISNPATFGAGATGLAGSVRFAFFNEGYTRTGSEVPGDPIPNPPYNLFAFREGGGIVPASGTTFDTIGAGTVGDPLRLSQFSGFTVPGLSVSFTTQLTDGATINGQYKKRGFVTSPTYDVLFPDPIGSVSTDIINLPGGGTSIFKAFYYRQVPLKNGFFTSGGFTVTGDFSTINPFTNINYNGVNWNIAGSGGTYDAESNRTGWFLGTDENLFTGTTRTFTLT